MTILINSYKAIKAFYEGKSAERTGVPYINHIDEGLLILSELDAAPLVQAAFCLHPIFQSDADLKGAVGVNMPRLVRNPHVLVLVMEYRNIANASLRHQLSLTKASEISLSPLPEVNEMLIADKIQNYKDFLKYHLGTHPDSDQLDLYFRLWLERLGVPEEKLLEYFKVLDFELPTVDLPVK